MHAKLVLNEVEAVRDDLFPVVGEENWKVFFTDSSNEKAIAIREAAAMS